MRGRGRTVVIVLWAALMVVLAAGAAGVTLALSGGSAPEAVAERSEPAVVTSTTTMVIGEPAGQVTVTPPLAHPRSGRTTAPSSTTPVSSLSPVRRTVTCRNGATAEQGSCGNYQCWDDSVVTEQRCPALAGAKALTWIFGVRSGAPQQRCRPVAASGLRAGELESIRCSWSDTPLVSVQLSRWRTVEVARAALTAEAGTPVAWLADDGGRRVREGYQWNSGSADQRVNAELYLRQPYSVRAAVRDAGVAGTAQWAKYFDRERLIHASTLDLALASAR